MTLFHCYNVKKVKGLDTRYSAAYMSHRLKHSSALQYPKWQLIGTAIAAIHYPR